jgi:hypothetical protein
MDECLFALRWSGEVKNRSRRGEIAWSTGEEVRSGLAMRWTAKRGDGMAVGRAGSVRSEVES